jgi:hypothetical protein
MTDAVLPQQGATLSSQQPDITAVAEGALTWALELCARKMGLDSPRTAAHHVRQGSAVARMYFRSSLAKQIAEFLGASEQDVRAILAPDYDVLFRDLCARGEAREESMVRLLVWTRRRTAALESLVIAWDRALAQAYGGSIGASGQAPLLDVQVVDDTDVEKHVGLARSEGMATRLAVYWMGTMNQVVDIVYDRGGT